MAVAVAVAVAVAADGGLLGRYHYKTHTRQLDKVPHLTIISFRVEISCMSSRSHLVVNFAPALKAPVQWKWNAARRSDTSIRTVVRANAALTVLPSIQ